MSSNILSYFLQTTYLSLSLSLSLSACVCLSISFFSQSLISSSIFFVLIYINSFVSLLLIDGFFFGFNATLITRLKYLPKFDLMVLNQPMTKFVIEKGACVRVFCFNFIKQRKLSSCNF